MDCQCTKESRMFNLKGFVEENKIKQKELSELLNVSQAYISNMINGKLPFSDEKVGVLRKKYGKIVEEYVTEGEFVAASGMTVKVIPLMPVSAQGGSLNDFVTSVSYGECEKIISPISDADIAISVSGESMSPEYPNGCKVIAKKVNERAFIEWGRTYVLDTRNGVVVKVLVPSEKEGFVKCVSINKEPIYAPFEVAMSDVFGVYRVQLCMSLK